MSRICTKDLPASPVYRSGLLSLRADNPLFPQQFALFIFPSVCLRLALPVLNACPIYVFLKIFITKRCISANNTPSLNNV